VTRLLRWSLAWLMLVASTTAGAHPLPNSLVTIKSGTIEIDTPASDVAIAMRAADVAPDAVGRYYLRHIAVTTSAGRRVPLSVIRAQRIDTSAPDVGPYSEWHVTLAAPAMVASGGRYTLAFDAIIHQIPNHIAFVRIEDGGPAPRNIGVIRYDFASRSIQPLVIDLASARMSSGFAAMIAIGYMHVLSGLDHMLFLVALLMVIPFEAVAGRWRFMGMNARAFRRFLAISGAFTLGHSVSLAAGTFGLDVIPVRWTEALVALSIVVAAVHALRPLFPRREWIVAGGFGLIHGLAFSEVLAALDLDLGAKIGALLAFNLGVEAAQLTVVAVSVPVLAISGARFFVRPRQILLLAIALVAVLWIGQRTVGLVLPGWLTF